MSVEDAAVALHSTPTPLRVEAVQVLVFPLHLCQVDVFAFNHLLFGAIFSVCAGICSLPCKQI